MMDEYMKDGEDPAILEHRMGCPRYAPRPFLPYYNDADWQKHYNSLECICHSVLDPIVPKQKDGLES